MTEMILSSASMLWQVPELLQNVCLLPYNFCTYFSAWYVIWQQLQVKPHQLLLLQWVRPLRPMVSTAFLQPWLRAQKCQKCLIVPNLWPTSTSISASDSNSRQYYMGPGRDLHHFMLCIPLILSQHPVVGLGLLGGTLMPIPLPVLELLPVNYSSLYGLLFLSSLLILLVSSVSRDQSSLHAVFVKESYCFCLF